MLTENNNDFKPEPSRIERFKSSKSFSVFLDGVTLFVVGVLVIIVAMLYFTQIGINTGATIAEVGFEFAILYGATVAIYMLLRSFARRKGRATEGYAAAFKTIESNTDKIISTGAAAHISEYCREWEESELDNTRERILADVGIPLADFKRNYVRLTKKEIRAAFPKLSKIERKTIERAKKIKRLKYNENYLSVYDKRGHRRSPSQFVSTKTLERLKVVQVLITTAISLIFGVTIALDVITNFTFATVVMCLIKIAVILASGVMGMIGGYNMTSNAEVEEMKIKAKEQDRFMKWVTELAKQPQNKEEARQNDGQKQTEQAL